MRSLFGFPLALSVYLYIQLEKHLDNDISAKFFLLLLLFYFHVLTFINLSSFFFHFTFMHSRAG